MLGIDANGFSRIIPCTLEYSFESRRDARQTAAEPPSE